MSSPTENLTRPRGASVRDAGVCAAVFGIVPTLMPVAPVGAAAAGALGVLLTARWRIRLVVLTFTAVEVIGLPWPAACLVAAIVYWLADRPRRVGLHGDLMRARSGWESTAYAIAGLLCGLLVVALDSIAIRAGYIFPLRIPPLWAIPVLALLLAVVNAISEELLWRWVLVDLLQPIGRPVLVVVVQAASFGIAHYFGIPQGPVGVLAATVYAVGLALVSMRAGLLSAIGVHIITDAVIFLAVAQHARFAWSGG